MNVLNAAFADTPYTFQAAGMDQSNNSIWYSAGPGTSEEIQMKSSLRQGDGGDLNMYISNPGGRLLAGRPSASGTPGMRLMMVWLSWALHCPGATRPQNEGNSATHEVGHWLGLYHSLQGGCRRNGGFVSDTPAVRLPNYGYPVASPAASRLRVMETSSTTWTTPKTPACSSSLPAR